VIDAIAQAYASRAQVAKLNVDDNPATAARYGIQGIPMLLLFHQGQLMDRLVGAHPRPVIEARLEAVLGAAAR
jgi:thioredoxin 1